LNDAVFVADIQTRIILDANQMALKLTGRTSGEIIGKDWSILHSAEHAGYYIEHFEKVLQEGSDIFEAIVVKKDGTGRTVQISFRVDELEGKKVIVSMFRDITERTEAAVTIKNGEDRLKKSHLEFRDYIDSTSDGVMIIDKKLNILNINTGGLKILEVNRENILGRNLQDINFEMEDRERKYIYRRLVKPEKQAKSNIVTIKARSGIKFIDIVAFKVKEGLGVSLRDITEQHKSAELIRMQKKDLENKNIALKEVIAEIEEGKKEIISNIQTILEKAIKPIIGRIGKNYKEVNIKDIELLKRTIEHLEEQYWNKSLDIKNKLSAREYEIANMIKSGFGSKDIAESLSISLDTVKTVRKNIRRKINISKKDINLYSFLQNS